MQTEADVRNGGAGQGSKSARRDVRDDGKGDGTIGSTEIPVKDLPPPQHQPPVTVPRAPVAPSPSQSTPPEAPGRDRDPSGSRQLEKQKPPKLSPERMRLVLDHLREDPVQSSAARKAGIHPKTLAYWLKRSKAGDDGYDIEWQDVTGRFHEHYESAIEEAHDELRGIELQRALGYDKVLTYRGRVSYKIDESLVKLGYQGPDAYLKDENGNPVPETVRKVDPKAIRFLLKSLRPEKYGKNPKIDIPQKGGVVVIGDETKKPEYNTAASVKARQWKAESRRIRKEKD